MTARLSGPAGQAAVFFFYTISLLNNRMRKQELDGDESAYSRPVQFPFDDPLISRYNNIR